MESTLGALRRRIDRSFAVIEVGVLSVPACLSKGILRHAARFLGVRIDVSCRCHRSWWEVGLLHQWSCR